MKRERVMDIARLFAEGTAIDEAIAQAVREAIARHWREGRPIAIYQDGAVVWVHPQDDDAHN